MTSNPTVAELSMFRDAALETADHARVADHADGCDMCARVLRTWSLADAALLAPTRRGDLWRRSAVAAALALALLVAGSGAAVGVVTMVLPAQGVASTRSDLPGARSATGLPLPASAALGHWTLREVHVTRGSSITSADLRYSRPDGHRLNVLVWTRGVSAVPAGTATSDVISGNDVTRYEDAGSMTASFEHRGSIVHISADAAVLTRSELETLIGAWTASAR